MIMTTTSTLEGYKIQQYIGVVSAEAIMGANIVRDVFASVRDVVGGRSQAYEEKLTEAREIATKEMTEKAESYGANAIIGIAFDFETLGTGMLMCVATGTAVKAVQK
ncbi:YbjQ family protein [Domibacillus epiphyticus]|uniref:UPF0145 protein BTO28_05295 n=1 Tax=Domibacillus epiphyticus TaxID=1714355 RepID=A0A1V2AAS3_9BACI|nr:YbjQ family protein [Domibacillus epiphyticus]OMP67904.1 hypothetical protein BTO28_05295 [Domibacillus epiphyticus]